MSNDAIRNDVDKTARFGISEDIVQADHCLVASNILFPEEDLRLRIDDLLTVSLSRSRQRLRKASVTPGSDVEYYRSILEEFDFVAGRDLGPLLLWIVHNMENGLVQVRHPRYFGLFNPTPTFPAECADRVIAVFNAQLASATTSPFAVAVERHTIKTFCNLAGLPDSATGHFTNGGSEANFTALVCALTHAEPSFRSRGARAFAGRPVFLVSSDSHLAWIKIAHQAGIGRDSVRLVQTDGAGSMCIHALDRAWNAEIVDGNVPVMIVATAGTTAGGMVDPLEACADFASKHKIWYHVDAAWGGAALVSSALKPVLAGIERADSITIDAHKWLATTMGCGMFLTADSSILGQTFGVTMECMPSSDLNLDPYLTTAQWSRRFSGLRLFASLAAVGWDGYSRHVEKSVQLARTLRLRLEEAGWRVVNRSKLAVLCLAPPVGSVAVALIVSRIVNSGVGWVSTVRFEGLNVVRVCISSGESKKDDILALAVALEAAAK